MWFLNKKTGLKWYVTDQGLMKRLESNAHYEVVEEAKPDSKSSKRNEKGQTSS